MSVLVAIVLVGLGFWHHFAGLSPGFFSGVVVYIADYPPPPPPAEWLIVIILHGLCNLHCSVMEPSVTGHKETYGVPPPTLYLAVWVRIQLGAEKVNFSSFAGTYSSAAKPPARGWELLIFWGDFEKPPDLPPEI